MQSQDQKLAGFWTRRPRPVSLRVTSRVTLPALLPATLPSHREDRGRSPQRDFHILFVPRRSLLCEQWLKEQGVLGSFIHREQYSLDLIPFDGDLLSMESESAFKVSPRLVSEEQHRAVLRWLLVFGAGRSEGITQPAGKGAEQSRGAELLCVLGEGTSTPAPPAVAAGAASANGVFLSLRVQERALFVSAHSWGPRAEVHAEPRQLPPTSCVSHSPSAASGDRKV